MAIAVAPFHGFVAFAGSGKGAENRADRVTYFHFMPFFVSFLDVAACLL
jgi:hypothetical protein